MFGGGLQQKIGAPQGLLAKALGSGQPVERNVEDLYLGTLSRFPDADERVLARAAVERAGGEHKGGRPDLGSV